MAYAITHTIPEEKLVLLDMRAFYTAGEMVNKGVTNDFYTIPTEPTLRGFLQLLLHTHSLATIAIPLTISSLLAALLFFFVWKAPWNTKNELFDFQWAILLIIVIITSLHTDYQDLLLLLFSCIILLRTIHKYLYFYSVAIGINMLLLISVPKPSILVIFSITLLGMLTKKYI